jgi:hypothetical protein
VDPGDHIVTVKAPGKKPWETKVWAEESSKLLVSISALEDVAPPPAPPPPPRSIVPVIALGAAGGAGIVAGAIFVGLRAGKVSDAEALRDTIAAKGGACVNGGGSAFATDCSALFSATGTGDTFGTVALVSFIVGGAALGGMAVYLLLPESTSARPATTGMRVLPVIGPGGGGLAASGSF